ncbi:hypothetical protein N7468_002131 [Penicillium chermesinum]|uniref:Endopolyphosphatase n=1 Tax=Penicillium chermesinum TaxID=63820 RepID=A0A9W9TY50_9EURO|nr:uncharacterized protein N7468_002131 [Penicillium chermesinum]KAJ5247148.1 hypothetical protein N7468_002131 [Penicillium chermesinum]
MMQSTVLLLGLLSAVSAVPVEQLPLAAPLVESQIDSIFQTPQAPLTEPSAPRLHGKFLHVTDFHPDRYYKYGASIEDGSCHHGKGVAGYFGQEGSDCDSPYTLVNETFRWLAENLKDDLDFVIWTGDSARHDNDELIPRSEQEIVDLNQYMAQKWIDLFGTRKNSDRVRGVPHISVPVVPTFGNNDIAPHNIFRKGPNLWTKRFAEVWHDFIPEDQRHSFLAGGWFTSEVIPGKLAVISLNTMYFFDSNSAVDGCVEKSQPGYEHMEWLRVQLQILRSRNMKAILMGHVPPARTEEKTNWDETCWQKYTLWLDRYRDVVVSGLYGHMNVDHFMLQDSDDVDFAFLAQKNTSGTFEGLDGSTMDAAEPEAVRTKKNNKKKKGKKDKGDNKKKKLEKKRRKFLKKVGGPLAERFSVTLVSPSVVPNYFPTLRVIEYNTTGLESTTAADDQPSVLDTDVSAEHPEVSSQNTPGFEVEFKVPDAPSPTSPPGPAYSNQALSFLGYTQYFANLTRINAEVAAGGQSDPRVMFEVEYSTDDKSYRMKDLTVRSFYELAIRIAEEGDASARPHSQPTVAKRPKVNKAWRAFLSRAFAGFLDVDDLSDDLDAVQ